MSGALMAKTTADVRDVLAAHGAPRRSPDGSGLKLRHARPDDKQFAGGLLREALTPELADAVFGLGVEGGATRYLEHLFARAGTLWSYDLVTLVEVDGQVAGLVSHAAWTELAQRYRATLWAYLRVYGPVRIFKLLPRLRALIRASPPSQRTIGSSHIWPCPKSTGATAWRGPYWLVCIDTRVADRQPAACMCCRRTMPLASSTSKPAMWTAHRRVQRSFTTLRAHRAGCAWTGRCRVPPARRKTFHNPDCRSSNHAVRGPLASNRPTSLALT